MKSNEDNKEDHCEHKKMDIKYCPICKSEKLREMGCENWWILERAECMECGEIITIEGKSRRKKTKVNKMLIDENEFDRIEDKLREANLENNKSDFLNLLKELRNLIKKGD